MIADLFHLEELYHRIDYIIVRNVELLYDKMKIGVNQNMSFIPLNSLIYRQEVGDGDFLYYKPVPKNTGDTNSYDSLVTYFTGNNDRSISFNFVSGGEQYILTVSKGLLLDSTGKILALVGINKAVTKTSGSDIKYVLYLSYDLMYQDIYRNVLARLEDIVFKKMIEAKVPIHIMDGWQIDKLFYSAYKRPKFETITQTMEYMTNMNDFITRDIFRNESIGGIKGLPFDPEPLSNYDPMFMTTGTHKGDLLLADMIESHLYLLSTTDQITLRQFLKHAHEGTLDGVYGPTVDIAPIESRFISKDGSQVIIGQTNSRRWTYDIRKQTLKFQDEYLFKLKLKKFNVYDETIAFVSKSLEQNYNFVSDTECIEQEL